MRSHQPPVQYPPFLLFCKYIAGKRILPVFLIKKDDVPVREISGVGEPAVWFPVTILCRPVPRRSNSRDAVDPR